MNLAKQNTPRYYIEVGRPEDERRRGELRGGLRIITYLRTKIKINSYCGISGNS